MYLDSRWYKYRKDCPLVDCSGDRSFEANLRHFKRLFQQSGIISELKMRKNCPGQAARRKYKAGRSRIRFKKKP